MKHKELKKELILSNAHKTYYWNKIKLKKECKNNWQEVKEVLRDTYGDSEFEALEQLSKARYEASKKIKEHIKYWIDNNYDVYFATFTYSDDKYKDIPADLLKRRVHTVCKQFDDFITNIDFGETNYRLHFHAAIAIKKDSPFKFVSKKEYYERIDHPDKKKIKGKYYIIEGNKALNNYEKKTGFYLLQKVKTDDKDLVKVSNYIAKLASHSLKEKQARVGVKTNTDYQSYKQAMNKLTKLKNMDDESIRIDTRDMKNFHKDLYETLYNTDLDKEKSNLKREQEEKASYELEKSTQDGLNGDLKPIEDDRKGFGLGLNNRKTTPNKRCYKIKASTKRKMKRTGGLKNKPQNVICGI